MLKKAEKPENVQPAAKRKLTRAERKQIEAIIRQAKGDGKPHTVQDSIPFRNLYPDGLCRLDDRLFSKTIAYEDVNYRLAGPDDQRDIFERLCDFYNGYDPSIGVQMTLSSRHEDKNGNLFGMDAQGDALDDMRVEASGILQIQYELSLIHISEPTRQAEISYAVFCLKKKNTMTQIHNSEPPERGRIG